MKKFKYWPRPELRDKVTGMISRTLSESNTKNFDAIRLEENVFKRCDTVESYIIVSAAVINNFEFPRIGPYGTDPSDGYTHRADDIIIELKSTAEDCLKINLPDLRLHYRADPPKFKFLNSIIKRGRTIDDGDENFNSATVKRSKTRDGNHNYDNLTGESKQRLEDLTNSNDSLSATLNLSSTSGPVLQERLKGKISLRVNRNGSKIKKTNRKVKPSNTTDCYDRFNMSLMNAHNVMKFRKSN